MVSIISYTGIIKEIDISFIIFIWLNIFLFGLMLFHVFFGKEEDL